MKKAPIFLVLLFVFGACESGTNIIEPIPDKPEEINSNLSENKMIKYTGRIAMTEGPHDLLIENGNLFAVRDYQVFKFSLSNPAVPSLQKTYSHAQLNTRFGKLHFADSKLWVACQSDGMLYEFLMDLSLIKKHDLQINSFKPNVAMKDAEGNYWVGGSNGSRGILAKYILQGGELKLISHWTASSNDSNIESMIEKDGYIIVSIPKGEIYSFDKTKPQNGIIQTIGYTHEAGHEKWGHSIIKVGNQAFWANWGAGMASVDISKGSNIKLDKVLSNSLLKSQFKDIEGTNVYDIAHNAKRNLLTVANGWSGLLLIRPENPDKVIDWIDPTYFQNRCVETLGDYIYTGNISGGMSGDLKGLMIFKIN